MFNKPPLFSIVIANYNGGKFIEQAIQSILSQSNPDFELIIVDGGSTDNSVEIIKKYQHKLAWWISEKDSGQSNAFNKGFAKAKGEFYFWVNSDDLLLPKSLEYAKNAIHKYPDFKWFCANTIFITNKNEIIKCSRGPGWHDFVIENGPIYVFGPTSIFHKELFDETGGFNDELHYTMDTDLWMRFKNNNYKFKRIDRYFWSFRIHKFSKTSHSFSGSPNENFRKEQILISKRNNHPYTRVGYYLQNILKIIGGTYLLAKYDTMQLKGKQINEITSTL